MTVLFCLSLGLGGGGASPGSTLHAYPITRQARCQALAALLLARRDTIERSGRFRIPVSLDRAPQARAGGGRAAPAPAQESARRQSGDGRRPKGAASGHAAAGAGDPAAQRATGSPERERRTKTRSPVPAAADRRAFCPPQFPARLRDGNYRRERAGTTKRQAPTTTTQPGTLEE